MKPQAERATCAARRSVASPARVCFGAVVLLTALLATAPAKAQVTVDLHALDALPRTAPPARSRSFHTTAHPPSRSSADVIARVQKPAPESTAGGAPLPFVSQAPLPSIAAGPPAPPPAALAPAIPQSPPAPPSMAVASAAKPPVTPSAPTERSLGIDFVPGSSDLPPQAGDKIAQMAHQSLTATTTFEVAAHAPATGGDASAARRLSLARALAARAALVAAGVPGSRIYVRALGAPPPNQADTADRASITVSGLGGGDIASPQAAASNQGKPP